MDDGVAPGESGLEMQLREDESRECAAVRVETWANQSLGDSEGRVGMVTRCRSHVVLL